MSYAFWLLIQLLLFIAVSITITDWAGGEQIDAIILFLLFTVGFRVGELHNKVDKLLKIKDNAPIK